MASRQKAARPAVASPTIDGKDTGRVLITGASAGIGAELARQFAAHGHPLTLVARRRDALQTLSAALTEEFGVDVKILVQDLAKPGGPSAVVKALEAEGEFVGILVNNAGVIDVRPFVEADVDHLTGMVDLNVRAVTELSHRLLPAMVDRGVGRILNVASLAAFQPVPTMATYAASKAFVLSFTEALSEELRGTGVKVTALCPGITDTNMVSEIQAQSPAARAMPRELISSPRDVAAEAYRALIAGRVVDVPGLPNQVAAAWAQVTPRWLTRSIAGLATRFGR